PCQGRRPLSHGRRSHHRRVDRTNHAGRHYSRAGPGVGVRYGQRAARDRPARSWPEHFPDSIPLPSARRMVGVRKPIRSTLGPMRFLRTVFIYLGIGAALGSAACSDESTVAGATGGRGGGTPAVPVTIAPVVQKAMPIEIQVIGSAEPFSTVAIRSQITGLLNAVNFREGDIVQKGQVLFELDKRPLVAALEQAQANLQRDMAQAANAEVQAMRLQQLVDRGIAPRDQGDTAKTSVVAMN